MSAMVGDRVGTFSGAGFPTTGDRRAEMTTTSHLGGRKAHTAKKRRVRYETGTRVLRIRVVVRMVRPLCHVRGAFDKWLPAPGLGLGHRTALGTGD